MGNLYLPLSCAVKLKLLLKKQSLKKYKQGDKKKTLCCQMGVGILSCPSSAVALGEPVSFSRPQVCFSNDSSF